jgi:hypothetical protein
MFALAEALQKDGFFVVPARTVREAESLLDELGVVVDTLLVNPRLPEAAIVGKRLRKRNPALKIFPLGVGTSLVP